MPELKTQKHTPCRTMPVMAKAKSLFAVLKEKAEPKHDAEFITSSGSFNDSRIVIHYIILK